MGIIRVSDKAEETIRRVGAASGLSVRETVDILTGVAEEKTKKVMEALKNEQDD